MTDYAYVRRMYDVAPVVGQRVRLEGSARREGVIAPEHPSQGHRVMVLFDGGAKAMPCHPSSLEYLSGVDQ